MQTCSECERCAKACLTRACRILPIESPSEWRDIMRNSQADLRLDNLVGSSQRTPTKLSFWVMASRPRTLTISATPVIVGTALAWAAQGRVHWLAVLAALIGSMFIQIGTNIHNDAADFERGGDGPDRIGPRARNCVRPAVGSHSQTRRLYLLRNRCAGGRLPGIRGRLANSPSSACFPSRPAGATPAGRFRLPTRRWGSCFA